VPAEVTSPREALVNVRLIAASVLVALAGIVLAGDAPKRHPHFEDKGTLSWSTKLADAQAAARSAGKLILIEYGREV
jgi:hypothetical protein